MTINELFKTATDQKASDLHIVVGKPPILRIDGELKILDKLQVITRDGAEKLIFSILTERQKKKFVDKRELDLSYELAKYSRYRVNLHWEKDNIGLVARVISNDIPNMDDLGLPEVATSMIEKTSGLCAYPGCMKPYEILHHTKRFALDHTHDPDTLVPLCKAHERVAHSGLIEDEEMLPVDGMQINWGVRLKADVGGAKYQVDQKVGEHYRLRC